MEERIQKIERELVVMAETQKTMSRSLAEISDTLRKLTDFQTETKLIGQKVEMMDSEVREAFERIYKRVDKLESSHGWVAKTIIGGVLTGAMATIWMLARHGL